MTSIAELPRFVPALCCECGAVRQAGFRNASAGHERPLKCSACGRQTTHAIIAPEGWDYGEEQNRKTKPNLSVEDQLDLLRSLGVEIRSLPDGYASVCRWLDGPELPDDPEWVVSVNLTAEDQRVLASVMTKVVAHVIRPDDHRWYVGTDDGQTYISVEWGHR